MSEQQPAFDALPEALRDPAARAWDACVAAGFDARALADPAVAQALPRVFACSRFVATSCARAPGLLADLTTSGELGRPRAPGELKARIGQALAGAETEAELMRVLRLERRRELVRIAWRDLAGASDLAESLAELSELAEVCIDAALERVQAALIARHGEPEPVDGAPQRLIVLAMGKLGGRELNFSSDVDLVFLFPEPGQTDGPRPLSNAELFTRVAQRLIHVLSAPTADGFVVRVDARLRPFGESGALVLHLRGLETYLQEHGREWERYAYVKARPLSGSAPHVAELDALLRPFVYRRYLDFGVFQALRDMRNLILREVERRDLRDDVKLGPGGIREAEFVVQAIQLLRGGRDPGLQTTEFARALARIRERRYLEAAAADALADAYRYLRHAENRLQAYADEQTHALPRDEAGLARLALAMGEPDAAAFRAALARHRVAVGAQFASVVLGPGREAGSTVAPLAGAWEGSGDPAEARAALAALGFGDPDEVLRLLRALRTGSAYGRLDKQGRERLDALVPRLLQALEGVADPHATLARVLAVVEAIGRRSAYLALLTENPGALRRLVDLASASPYIARLVAAHPLLLDDLLDPRLFDTVPTREELAADLRQRVAHLAPDDLEAQMEALRQFQQSAVLRIAVADLQGVIALIDVSNLLTDVAEIVLGQALALARAQLELRHGAALGAAGPAGLAIVAYGKLGGRELGYGSDLDIVFLHDARPDAPPTTGPKPLPAPMFFSRLASRVLHFLATQTHSGTLYRVDTRLRPSGSKGLLVSSIEAFAEYQAHEAWTWEHQALLRARAVAGDPGVAAAFEDVRRRVLCTPRDPERLRRDVLEMRERMRRELSRASAGEFDMKQDAGGIVDIEFIVQYLVLREAAARPELVEHTDNLRQLQALARAGVIAPRDAEALFAVYRRYREQQHWLALREERRAVVRDEHHADRALVTDCWQRVFGTPG